MITFTFPLLDLPPLPIEAETVGQGSTPAAQKPPQKAKTHKVKRCDRCRQPQTTVGVVAVNFCEPCDRESNPYFYISEHHRILGRAGNYLQEIAALLQESFHSDVNAHAGTRQFITKHTEKHGQHYRLPFFEIHLPQSELSVLDGKEIVRAAVIEVMRKNKESDDCTVFHMTPTNESMGYSIGLMEHLPDSWNGHWKIPPQ